MFEDGEISCDLCKNKIKGTDDFVVHVPLPTAKSTDVQTMHLQCWEKTR